MPNVSSLFHDTLLNKINELIASHVRFIDNKIGNKREHSLQLINLLILISKLKNVQTTGWFTNFPCQCRMQVANQFPCHCIGTLASIL